MATRTWTGGGADALASNVLNWDGGASAPAAGDDVVFDGATPVTGDDNCTWDITTNLNTLDVQSGYSGTITLSATMNVTNTTGTLTINPTGTFDSNGQAVNCKSLDASGAATKTITCGASVWTIAGNTNISGTNLTFTESTSEFVISANGTVTQKAGITFYKFTCAATSGSTVTLGSDIYVSNTLDLHTTFANITYTGNKFYASGNVTEGNVSGGTPSGTTVLEFTGSAAQTWSQGYSGGGTYQMGLDVIINKSGNTLTFSGTIAHGGNFTYTAGTVSTTGSTLEKCLSKNMNSGTIAWNNVTFSATFTGHGTTTLTGNLDVNGALQINASQTLSAGSNTINCAGNFTNNGTFTRATSTVVFDGTTTLAGATSFHSVTLSASTAILASSSSFVCANKFKANGASGALIVFKTTTAGTGALFPVLTDQEASWVAATDIDSRGGKMIINNQGTLSNTFNWAFPSQDKQSYVAMAM